MASLFDLPMAPSSPDHGVSNMYFTKVEPTQGIRSNAGFGSSRIQFEVNPAVNEWLVPSRSYFRVRATIKSKTATPNLYVGIAATGQTGEVYPAYGFCSKLFSQASLQIGGTVVNSVATNLPQVDAMHKRSTLSRVQLETSDGLYQTRPEDRKAQFLAQERKADDSGYNVSAATEGEVVWTPPLGFHDVTHAVPASKYQWNFVANPNFLRDCLDGNDTDELSVSGVDDGKQTADAIVVIESMVLYACFVKGRDGSDEKWALNCPQIQCQALQFSTGQANLQLKNFDVPSDTAALAIAFQSSSEDNKYGGRSLFRIASDGNGPNDQTNLGRWYLSYDSTIYPQEQSEQAVTTGQALISQRYRDTQAQTGLLYSPGSPQTIDEWLRKTGAFYFVNWPRVQSQATRVQVNAALSSATPFQCLLFSVSQQSFLVRTADGRVKKVEIGE